MTDFRDYADDLQQEVVTDMAEAYFGARKDIDDMLEAFNAMVEELRQHLPRLSQAAARLHRLLLDMDTAREFYIALDVVPACIPVTEDEAKPFFDSLPFAFTGLGRYQRCVFRAYDLLQKAVDEYLNGRYFDDPEQPGRKRLTVHYLRLKAMAEYINEEIDKVNDTTVSGTLKFIKTMDPEQMQHEGMMGQAVKGADHIDQDMRFSPVDFDGLELPDMQDLPALYVVRDPIKHFCSGLYKERRDDIAGAMRSLLIG